MNLKSLAKKSFVFRHCVVPYYEKKTIIWKKNRQALFQKVGADTLRDFVVTMESAGISYWLEFGTLLGAYRDGFFIKSDLDIDVGVQLRDASRIFGVLSRNNYRLVREFHVVGENGLEQTYEKNGITIDLMYFYEENDHYYCNGGVFPSRWRPGTVFEHVVTAHIFKPFGLKKIMFLGMEMSIPANTEEHLIEIYGEGFRVYDPYFKGDYNKVFFPLTEKRGIGFIME